MVFYDIEQIVVPEIFKKIEEFGIFGNILKQENIIYITGEFYRAIVDSQNRIIRIQPVCTYMTKKEQPIISVEFTPSHIKIFEFPAEKFFVRKTPERYYELVFIAKIMEYKEDYISISEPYISKLNILSIHLEGDFYKIEQHLAKDIKDKYKKESIVKKIKV